jgi:hypothetical protein
MMGGSFIVIILLISFWIIVGGGGGFAIGIAKGRRLEGLLLGVFLSIVGWIVVSLLPNKLPNPRSTVTVMRDVESAKNSVTGMPSAVSRIIG